MILIISTLTSCINGSHSSKGLDAVEVKDKFISPEDGLTITDARMLIIQKLKDRGIKGNTKEVAIIEEITTQEIWKNAGTQLYKVDVGYASFYGVAIIKYNEVLEILHGMPTMGIFLADLDKDSVYEVYTNIAMGSGIISHEILGYNIATKDRYHLSKRGEQDFIMFIDEDILMAKVSKYPDINRIEKIGNVLLKTSIDKEEIYVE